MTAIGSLPLRAGRQFQSGRKLGNTHQYVLCFYNGDPSHIRDIYGHVEVAVDIEPPETTTATEMLPVAVAAGEAGEAEAPTAHGSA